MVILMMYDNLTYEGINGRLWVMDGLSLINFENTIWNIEKKL